MSQLFLLLMFIDPAPVLRIEAGKDASVPTVIATLPADLAAKLPDGKVPAKDGEPILRMVLVDGKDKAVGPAILGTYRRDGRTLTFTPRFALAASHRYRAVLTLDGKETSTDYSVPGKPVAPAPSVSAVYPTGDELPTNQLKFYLHFSKPMREGPAVFDQIRLLDDKGEPVEDPWRRTELWNEDATRLTLWIHPGRIKEGVNLRDEIGPVLESNRKYMLVVSEKLLDADGQPLGKRVEKPFRTTAAVRTAIDVDTWKLTTPEAGIRKPLEVKFPRPLDHALLSKSLGVTDSRGKSVAGTIAIGAKEASWTFTPDAAWAEGTFTLTIDERLEDLAGNSILRPFDRNLKEPPRKDAVRTRSFRIGAKQ